MEKKVPHFQEYYPTVDIMSYEQRDFYNYLTKKFEQKEYPSVEGNISYLFVYAYNLLTHHDKEGYEYIYNNLLDLSEIYYHENHFSSYVKSWAYDCLLGLEKYEEYLLLTEPEDVFSVSTHSSNERCNIYYHINKPVNPIDVLKMSYNLKITKYTKQHPTAFRDFIVSVFSKDAEQNGAWLDRLIEKSHQTYHNSLFNGAPINQPLPKFPCYCFYSSPLLSNKIPELIRIAENQLRDAHNIPKIGEGWISETALYYAIKTAFPQTKVIQHGSPEWLGSQHLDIWIPYWKIAIEYQGKQHFEPVDFFGGSEGFKATQKRDAKKKRLCKKNNVALIAVTEDHSHEQVAEMVDKIKYKKTT